MTSLEIAGVVESRHDSVKRTIERLAEKGVIQLPPMVEVKNHLGQSVEVYCIGERDSYVIVAQLSPEFTASLVDYWQKHKHQKPVAIPTTAEAFASAFQMLAAAERLQAEQAQAIAHIQEKVDEVALAQTVSPSKPAGAETITDIRKRIACSYGLSASIIEEVMRQTSYAPRPATMVQNHHPEAVGQTYAVYWKKDITKVFNRFAVECKQETVSFRLLDKML